jgi:hypothetical protein
MAGKKFKIGVALLFLLVVGLLAGLRWNYGVTMERAWAAKLDQLRRTGNPMTLSELAPPPVPDNENAAVLYQQAFVLLNSLPEKTQRRLGDLIDQKAPLTPKEVEEARSLLVSGEQVLKLVRQGASRSRCLFPIDYSAPAYNLPLHHLAHLGGSLIPLKVSWRVNLAEDKADEAVADVVTMLRVAQGVHNEPVVLSAEYEVMSTESALKKLEKTLEDTEPSRKALKDVSDALGNISDRGGYVRAARGELCLVLSVIDMGLKGRLPDQSQGLWERLILVVGRPWHIEMFLPDVDIACEWHTLVEKPMHESGAGWDAQVKKMETLVTKERVAPISGMTVFAMRSVANCFDRGVARKSCAKLAIALRLYRMKNGEYPQALSLLAPDFVDKLPVDPFSGKDFIYRREGSGFVVYSVGPNMTDNGGVEDAKNRDAGDIVWKCAR